MSTIERHKVLGDVYIEGKNGQCTEHALLLGSAGYLVVGRSLLLVLHNGFQRWVPPGGHLEPDDTFQDAAVREVREEVGLHVEVVSASPNLHLADENATPQAAPFYVDIVREGFRKPCLMQYFFVAIPDDRFRLEDLVVQKEEISDARLLTPEQLAGEPTFDQVRSIAGWVADNHPRPARAEEQSVG
jgi:8-oxo-dGTP pyrophosphatase MutT (NUDIX family)